MKRLVGIGLLGLALLAPSAPAMARGRGPVIGGAGFRHCGPSFHGGFGHARFGHGGIGFKHGGFGFKHGGASFRAGFGFGHCHPFHKGGFHGSFHHYPYSYAAFPYYGGFGYPYFTSPYLGTPYLGYPYLSSSYLGSAYLGTPYISSLYGTPAPTVIQLPPRYVYITPPEDPEDRRDSLRPQERREGDRGAGDRYYLDQRVREEADRVRATTSIVDLVRHQLRVTYLEPGSYLVRWTGPVEGLTAIEFQAVDAKGKVRHSKTVKELPLQGVLRVDDETAGVHVLIESKDGATAAVKLPVAEFKALQPKESR